LALFPFALIFWILGTEYIQYLILGSPEEQYVVKLSQNPTDYLLLPIISLSYLFVGLTENPNIPLSAWSFIAWIITIAIADFVFSLTHYTAHTHPSIRKLHLVHHEYRKEDLNTMANFYAEVTDSFIMNSTFFTYGILTVLFSQHTIGLKEFLMVGGHTHHKYPTNTLTLSYFFEYELIDMILNQVRMSNYHNEHHNHVEKNYGGFGFFSDEFIKNTCDQIKSLIIPKEEKKIK